LDRQDDRGERGRGDVGRARRRCARDQGVQVQTRVPMRMMVRPRIPVLVPERGSRDRW
jgi:hypothetical protein